MQVYLPAIDGHVPERMVQTMCAFLEFCYIARRDIHDTHSLSALDNALQRFHQHCEIFRESGVCSKGFNLPRQHSYLLQKTHLCFWGTKWPLLLYYRVQAYKGCERAMAALKSF